MWYQKRSCSCPVFKRSKKHSRRSDSSTQSLAIPSESCPKQRARTKTLDSSPSLRDLLFVIYLSFSSFSPRLSKLDLPSVLSIHSFLCFFSGRCRGRAVPDAGVVCQPSLSDRPIVVQCCTPSLDPLVTIRCLWPKERVVAPPQAERTAHRSSSSSLSLSSFFLSLSSLI